MRECGKCSLCCKVMGVDSINKPTNQWCDKFKSGVGCTIHQQEGYPKMCGVFKCLWLQRDAISGLPDHLRPDRIHIVMTTMQWDGKEVTAFNVDKDWLNAHCTPEMKAMADWLVERQVPVVAIVGDRRYQRYPGEWRELTKE